MITEFSRTEMLIGPKALNALKGSCVVVFGAGGVGSHAIEAPVSYTHLTLPTN